MNEYTTNISNITFHQLRKFQNYKDKFNKKNAQRITVN